METVFESDRIAFTGISEEFVDDYLGMVNDTENVGRFIGKIHDPYTVEEETAWVRKKIEEKAHVFTMIEKESGQYIGNIEFMNVNEGTGELGIAITAKKQNKGYGTEAIRAFLSYGMSVLGLERVFLRAKPFNARALYVYEKCGFREYMRTEDHIHMELFKDNILK